MALKVTNILCPAACLTPCQLITVLVVLGVLATPASSSIGYFESYGWPSYGIVKPLWMVPFSAHPSRSISQYSARHNIVSAGIVTGRNF